MIKKQLQIEMPLVFDDNFEKLLLNIPPIN